MRMMEKKGGGLVYTIAVRTKQIPVGQCLQTYCFPERFLPLCHTCPEYDRNWSCPAGVPDACSYLARYDTLTMIGVQVFYDKVMRAQTDPATVERLQQESYGKVKKILLETLLGLEHVCLDAMTIAAGRCEQCDRCARLDGRACIKPQRLRYSFSAFGFDLTAMARDLLGVELLWSKTGLPEYHAALAAFLTAK